MKNNFLFITLTLIITTTTSSVNANTPPQACFALKQQLQKIIPSTFVFADTSTNRNNEICSFATKNTGELFEKNQNNFATWASLLNDTLQKNGWRQTKHTLTYAADGPFATTFALEKNSLLTIVSLQVDGSTNACPKNEPMDLYANCQLKPKDRNYQIAISLRRAK